MTGPVVVLAGGVGAARILTGLAGVIDPNEITVIGNTGDDLELHGLSISPDLDTVTYTLAGVADPEQGWGIANDTFECLGFLGRYSGDTWFRLGDRDLATHIYRTALLNRGVPLSEVTAAVAERLGVASRILPMSDDTVRTWITTPTERVDFQTYFVRRRARDEVRKVEFEGTEDAKPAPGVVEAIESARAVIIAPSNPFISIGPILAVPGIREALRKTTAPVAAVAPVAAGRAFKGPTARMMAGLGHEVSAFAVAELYQDFLHSFVIDKQDTAQVERIADLGIKVVTSDIAMSSDERKKSLAARVLEALEAPAS